MKSINKNDRDRILTALKYAYNDTIEKQNICRDRLDVMEQFGNKAYLKNLPFIRWDCISKDMADECWPATHQDRQKHLNQNFDEIPSYIQIQRIEDDEIRSRTYFLGEVVDHYHRIKSMAKFYEIFCSSPKDQIANMFLGLWIKHNVGSQLANEQLESGNQQESDSMLLLADTARNYFDFLAENLILSKEYDIK